MEFEGLHKCTGFDWDDGNAQKNWKKHKVAKSECEQVFFNRPLLVADDDKHSQYEKRYYALGRMDKGGRLFLVFTLRGESIRLISARDMSRSERIAYGKENPRVST